LRCFFARADGRRSAALPEGWGFDGEGAEVDVALATVVDLVVDGVLDGVDAGFDPLAEGVIELSEAVGRDVGEFALSSAVCSSQS
jgi:hypothetical protein